MSGADRVFLFKRSNGYWYIILDHRGKRTWKSTGCKLKSDALKALASFDSHLTPEPPAVTLQEFSHEFLAWARPVYSRKTCELYSTGLCHLKVVTAECLLTEVSAHHIDQYRARRLDQVSPVTVNVELRALRAIFSYAVRWGKIPANPFAHVKLCHIPDKSPAFLSPQDLEKLLDVVKDHWIRNLILFAVATGLRRGELVNLRWDDVDLAKKVIHVQSREGFRVKAGRSRVVPLSDLALEVLGRQDRSVQCGLVFHRKGRRVNGTFLAAKFKRFVRAAGLDESIHWHSLRSSFASLLVMKGVSIYAVSRLLGHSEVGVTQKCYAHLLPENLHDEVNQIKVSRK